MHEVYAIPAPVRRALESIFGEGSTAAVQVVRRPWYVRAHLVFAGARSGSVTRPSRIYTNLPADVFFGADQHVLHEFYHVIEQWNRQRMSRIGYLVQRARREAEADAFARLHLCRYRDQLR
jgi:hypothetical protein